MKRRPVTLNIAATELKLIFSTPVAWVMLIIFTVLCGMFFTDVLKLYAQANDAGSQLSFVTEDIFASDGLGLFPKVQAYLFLFIPLVSMGMISRDLSGGTVRLLYSSPVSDTQIVAGKFLALAGYGLSMMAVVSIFVCFGCLVIVNPDIPLVLTGMLGLYLLLCTYSAVGLFMSSLTSYQVVAALSTFAALAVLSMIGEVGQDIVWMRDVTWWLSAGGRCEDFICGLICSENVVYFISLTAFFLTLTILRISGKRRSRSRAAGALSYLGAVAVLVLVSFVSSQPRLMAYYDATETRRQTITEPSQEVMKRVEGPVELTTYVNILDEEGFYLGVPSRFNNDKAYIRHYLRFKPDIKLKYVYYWADAGSAAVKRRFPDLGDEERADRIADIYEIDFKMFLNPSQIAEMIDLSGEEYKLVKRIKLADGRTTFLRVFDDSERLPEEEEITAAFKRLLDGSVPVGFLSGHGERDINRIGDDGYYAFANARRFRHSLLNNGFDAVKLTLDGEKAIPDSIGILVIADPREAFSDGELAEIRRYIDSGRNLILAAEPGRQDFANQVAGLLGANFNGGRISVPKGDNPQNLVLADVSATALSEMPELADLKKEGYRITMPNAVGIDAGNVTDFRYRELLLSPEDSWNELQTTDFANSEAAPDSLSGETSGPKVVSAMLEREIDGGEEQRILLLGDADCFSNSELMRDRYAVSSGNFTFLYQLFRWMSYGEYPVSTPRPLGSDNEVRISVDNVPAMKWGFVAVLPLLMLFCSMMTIIRRKSE